MNFNGLLKSQDVLKSSLSCLCNLSYSAILLLGTFKFRPSSLLGSRASPPLFAGERGTSLVILVNRRWGASYTYTGRLSWLLHEILLLLTWWSGQWPLRLDKEVSCPAFSSLPSPTLNLQHHFCHTARDTAVAPSGGRSFIAATPKQLTCLEGESAVSVILWHPRGRAMAVATALLGPWLD